MLLVLDVKNYTILSFPLSKVNKVQVCTIFTFIMYFCIENDGGHNANYITPEVEINLCNY